MRRLLLLVAYAGAGCSVPDGEWFGRVPAPDPTHLRYCNMGEPEYLDPSLAQATNDLKIVYELFDGLTSYDDKGLPRPSLAERWEISPDFRHFRFFLRHDARWSNGRPIVADDFVYSMARVLHPLTASRHAEALWRIKHGKDYTAGRARRVLADAPPFRAGDAVRILEEGAPDTNLRRTRAPLPLRAAPDAAATVWATAPAGADLTVVEARGGWLYLFYPEGDGLYAWAPADALDAPNAERRYQVQSLDDDRRGAVAGRDLLQVPEILGIRAPTPDLLEIDTEGPVPFFLDLTLHTAFRPVPREAVSRWPRDWVRPERIVTSGPFHLDVWRMRDRIETSRSATFWGHAGVRLARLTFLSMGNQAAIANVYYQGGCDAVMANSVPNSMIPVLTGRRDYHRAPMLSIYTYLVQVQRFPNVHFRRALAHALDRTALPSFLKGGQIPTESYTPGRPIRELSDDELAQCGATRDQPGMVLFIAPGLCYLPPIGPRFDLAAAAREMEIARAELGERFPRSLSIKFNSGVEQHKTIAEWVQRQWEDAFGIEVRLQAQDWNSVLKATVGHDFDVARITWNGNLPDPEGEFLNVFKCASPDNRTGFCDPEVERLYAAAEATFDRAERLRLVRRVEQIIIDAAPVIPMYVYTQHVLIKPYVHGLAVTFNDHQSFRDVWIEAERAINK